MNPAYENFDVLIGIDRRGVAHVIKHRTRPLTEVSAEVKLTQSFTETFTSETKDTGLLAPVVARAARVAVDAGNIKALLLDATGIEGQWVEISGHKIDGSPYKRPVRPISIGSRAQHVLDSSEYLYCTVAGGETRTYRLDGIERAEFVEIA